MTHIHWTTSWGSPVITRAAPLTGIQSCLLQFISVSLQVFNLCTCSQVQIHCIAWRRLQAACALADLSASAQNWPQSRCQLQLTFFFLIKVRHCSAGTERVSYSCSLQRSFLGIHHLNVCVVPDQIPVALSQEPGFKRQLYCLCFTFCAEGAQDAFLER